MWIQIEGPQLMQYGFKDAIAKVGLTKFLSDLFWIGMFYHLYNQVCKLKNISLFIESSENKSVAILFYLMFTLLFLC